MDLDYDLLEQETRNYMRRGSSAERVPNGLQSTAEDPWLRTLRGRSGGRYASQSEHKQRRESSSPRSE